VALPAGLLQEAGPERLAEVVALGAFLFLDADLAGFGARTGDERQERGGGRVADRSLRDPHLCVVGAGRDAHQLLA
jgi:hypothetical protein